LKAYTYTAQELGKDRLPDGQLRLSGFDRTTDPRAADVFIVPAIMQWVGKEALLNLPYLKGNERRHVMFNLGEWMGVSLGIPAIMIRCDTTKRLLTQDPTAVAWPWPVEDLGAWIDRPFETDVVFRGWVSTPLTDTVCDSVLNTPSLKSHIYRSNRFYGYIEPEEQKVLHQSFLETLAASRLSLCARSIPEGVVRYRLYESLSMGRVPVHFCDGCVMPFADRIDWDFCTLTIPEADAPAAGDIIADWLGENTDEKIRERGAYGRAMWDRWLNSAKWDQLFAEVTKERLAVR
jgi:hypothetical protein